MATTLADVASMLRQVNARRLPLVPTENPQYCFAGNVEYRTPNGWKIVVFNDCNDWDYFDKIVAPDGTVFGFNSLWESPEVTAESTRGVNQPADLAWRIYRIPGHLTYRCEKCSRLIWPSNGDMVCTLCGGASKPEVKA